MATPVVTWNWEGNDTNFVRVVLTTAGEPAMVGAAQRTTSGVWLVNMPWEGTIHSATLSAKEIRNVIRAKARDYFRGALKSLRMELP